MNPCNVIKVFRRKETVRLTNCVPIRLLETKGLPLLKNESRYIRFQGKGHEADDLKRLMTYYTVWANNLYPKLRFKDFARRVRKPASGNRIKEMLSVWQQEHTEKVQARREVLQELSGETVGG